MNRAVEFGMTAFGVYKVENEQFKSITAILSGVILL